VDAISPDRTVRQQPQTKNSGSPIFRDDELVGFGVQIRLNGRKSFTLDYVTDGRRESQQSIMSAISQRAKVVTFFGARAN